MLPIRRVTVLILLLYSAGATQEDKLEEAIDRDSKISPPEEDYVGKEVDGVNITDNTQVEEDNHDYYKSSFYSNGRKFWVELKDAITHDLLSQSHRRASILNLTFDFPFYGHNIRHVTVATGGFLFTGPYHHSWLASTQYIAPLMANFDTSHSSNARIKYADNGTALTVEWDNVLLEDNNTIGEFTFQVTIHKSGDIVFAYKNIPVSITSIAESAHPVKVGIADAYTMEKALYFIRKKTIYEYHRIDMKDNRVGNWTAIYFTALSTCATQKSCTSCFQADTSFVCMWCTSVGRCSDGLDRYRQDWIRSGCENETNILRYTAQCSVEPDRVKEAAVPTTTHSGGLAAVSIIVSLFVLALLWLLYAYYFPHTTSGQLLIQYRPSQWRLRRNEARYTAATIHM